MCVCVYVCVGASDHVCDALIMFFIYLGVHDFSSVCVFVCVYVSVLVQVSMCV